MLFVSHDAEAITDYIEIVVVVDDDVVAVVFCFSHFPFRCNNMETAVRNRMDLVVNCSHKQTVYVLLPIWTHRQDTTLKTPNLYHSWDFRHPYYENTPQYNHSHNGKNYTYTKKWENIGGKFGSCIEFAARYTTLLYFLLYAMGNHTTKEAEKLNLMWIYRVNATTDCIGGTGNIFKEERKVRI